MAFKLHTALKTAKEHLTLSISETDSGTFLVLSPVILKDLPHKNVIYHLNVSFNVSYIPTLYQKMVPDTSTNVLDKL